MSRPIIVAILFILCFPACTRVQPDDDQSKIECGATFKAETPYILLYDADGQALSASDVDVIDMADFSPSTLLRSRSCLELPQEDTLIRSNQNGVWMVGVIKGDHSIQNRSNFNLDVLPEQERIKPICADRELLTHGPVTHNLFVETDAVRPNFLPAFKLEVVVANQQLQWRLSKPGLFTLTDITGVEDGDYPVEIEIFDYLRGQMQVDACRLRFDRTAPESHVDFKEFSQITYEGHLFHQVNRARNLRLESSDLDVVEIQYCLQRLTEANKEDWLQQFAKFDCQESEIKRVASGQLIDFGDNDGGFWILRHRAIDQTGNQSHWSPSIGILRYFEAEVTGIQSIRDSFWRRQAENSSLEPANLYAMKDTIVGYAAYTKLPTSFERRQARADLLATMLLTLQRPVVVHGIDSSEETVSLAKTPDDRWLLQGTKAGQIHFWDMKTGIEAREPLNNAVSGSGTKNILLSPDGQTLVTNFNGVIKIWDVDGLSPRKTIEVEQKFLTAEAITPDGTGILSFDETSFQIWDIRSGEPTELAMDIGQTTHPRPGAFPTAVAFSRDGQRLVVGYYGGWIHVYDLETRDDAFKPINNLSQFVVDLAISSDNSLIFAGSWRRGVVKTWSLRDGGARPFRVESAFGKGLTHILLSEDDQTLVCTYDDGSYSIWKNFNVDPVWEGVRAASSSLEFALLTEDLRIITGAKTGMIKFWDTKTGFDPLVPRLAQQGENQKRIERLLIPSAEDKILSGGLRRPLHSWTLLEDDANGRVLTQFPPTILEEFSPNGKILAVYLGQQSESDDHILRLYSNSDGKELGTLRLDDKIKGMGFASEHKFFAYSSERIYHFDLREDKPQARVSSFPDGDSAFEIRPIPNSEQLAGLFSGADFRSKLLIWPWNGAVELGSTVASGLNGTTAWAISRDGSRLAYALDEERVQLWNINSQQLEGVQWQGFNGATKRLAFSYDGRLLFSTNESAFVPQGNHSLSVWDISNRDLLAVVQVPTGEAIETIKAFPASDRLAISTKIDYSRGKLYILDVRLAELAGQICQKFSAYIERSPYFPEPTELEACFERY